MNTPTHYRVALALGVSLLAMAIPATGETLEVYSGEKNGQEMSFSVGGALRFNYTVKSWPSARENQHMGGEVLFDTFRLNTALEYGILSFDAEYRFYAGYHMLHHGYVGLRPSDRFEIQFGVMQKPFGILPWASHNWFFSMSYYVGLEDDYDAGIKVILNPTDQLDIRLAWFLNSEGSFTGSSRASARYSYDVVPTADDGYISPASNQRESHEGVARIAYTLDHGELGATELGFSGALGGLYNTATRKYGTRWATGVHLDTSLAAANIQIGVNSYGHSPDLPSGTPGDSIAFGAYDAPYLVAARGTIVAVGLAWTFEVERSVLDSIQVYNDYSVLLKHSGDDMPATHQNVLGALFSAGPIYTYTDFGFSRHHPFLSPEYVNGLAAARDGRGWDLRFNINMGVYF